MTYSLSVVPVRTAAEREAYHDVRHKVFVEEQRVPAEIERDAYDSQGSTWHLLGYFNGAPAGAVRVVFTDGATAKIGRLAVLPGARKSGLGRLLMETVLEDLPGHHISKAVLSAQAYLQNFYEGMGFQAVGDRYEEAGIEHVWMEKNPLNPTKEAG